MKDDAESAAALSSAIMRACVHASDARDEKRLDELCAEGRRVDPDEKGFEHCWRAARTKHSAPPGDP